MQFESQKISERVQDGLLYNAILSKIYFTICDTFIAFMPFIGELSDFDNVIKSEILKKLNDKSLIDKLLGLYADNKTFFESQYNITESDVESLNTDSDRADLIIGAILDQINLFPNDLNSVQHLQSKRAIFGANDENIVECPAILRNWPNLANASTIPVIFTPTNDKPTFKDIYYSDTYFNYTNGSGEDYRDIFFHDYYFDNVLKKKVKDPEGAGYHFETFVSFDFDRSKYDFEQDKNAIRGFYYPNELQDLNNDPTFYGPDYETILFTYLDTCFYLPNWFKEDKTKNIIVNPTIFKAFFSPNEEDLPELSYGANGTNYTIDKFHMNNGRMLVQKYLSKFISNIRVGIRLVHRQPAISTDSVWTEDENKTVSSLKDLVKNKPPNYLIKIFASEIYDPIYPVFAYPNLFSAGPDFFASGDFHDTYKNFLKDFQGAYGQGQPYYSPEHTVKHYLEYEGSYNFLPYPLTENPAFAKTAVIKDPTFQKSLGENAFKYNLSALERTILKDKYFLLSNKTSDNKIKLFPWIPLLYAYSEPFKEEYTYENIVKFINDNLYKEQGLSKIKNILYNKSTFRQIFKRMIPAEMFSVGVKVKLAQEFKEQFDLKMAIPIEEIDPTKPENYPVLVAKSIKQSLNETINSLLKDKQKEY